MPRNSLSNLEVERTRDTLCSAALDLYRDEGESAITFRRLAQQTGTSHTHAYRYFSNKAELFATMRLRCYQRFARTIRNADCPTRSPADRLLAVHSGIMKFVRSYPEQFALMFSTTQPPLDEYARLLAVRRDAFDHLVSIVQQAVDDGDLDGDARDTMHVAWGAVHGLVHLHLADQLVHGRDLESLSSVLLKQVFHPLFDKAPDDSANNIEQKGASA